MSKNQKNVSAAELRADVEAKTATWRELEATAETARANYRAGSGTGNPHRDAATPGMLVGLTLEIAMLEAEQCLLRAEHDVKTALDAAEAAEGSAEVSASDPKHLRADLLALDALELAIQDRRKARLVDAFTSDVEVNRARRAAGLPVRPPLPALHGVHAKSFTERLATFMVTPVPCPNRTQQIDAAKALRAKVAADLEEVRLEEEAAAKRADLYRRNREEADADERRRIHAAEKAASDAAAAERTRRDELAASYLNRGAAQ